MPSSYARAAALESGETPGFAPNDDGTVIFHGREFELQRIANVLRAAEKDGAPRAIRLVGPSGIGKSTLLAAVAEASHGWLPLVVAANRIQTAIPLSMARRLATSLLSALGEKAAAYSSGLTLEDPDAFGESFFRLLEGVSLDHRLLLAVDDAQWADEISRALIVRAIAALGKRAIVLLSAERSDLNDGPAFALEDVAIAVHPLDDEAARATLRDLLPQSAHEAIDAIATYARGNPLDLTVLAEATDATGALTVRSVDATLRKVVASELMLLDRRTREFLQLCSLCAEPIDLALLRALFSEDDLLENVDRTSPRYLTSEPEGIRFVHAGIRQSVQETIAIEIPFRRRIISALKSLPSLQLEDYEHLIQQAEACADDELVREGAIALGDAALHQRLLLLAANAYERAAEIGLPDPSQILPFYARLAMLYTTIGAETDVTRVCHQGLRAAAEAGITSGTGMLAAALLLAQFHAYDRATFDESFARYDLSLQDPDDRIQLASVGVFVAICDGDEARVRRYFQELESEAGRRNPIIRIRTSISKAFFASRSGRGSEALAALRVAYELTEAMPAARTMPIAVEAYHIFTTAGVANALPLLEQRRQHPPPYLLYLRAVVALARGEIADVRLRVREALVSLSTPFFRRLLLAVSATAAALGNEPLEESDLAQVVAETQAFYSGDGSSALRGLLSAWTVRESASNPTEAARILWMLLEAHTTLQEPTVFAFPVLFTIAASNLNDKKALAFIAAGNLACEKQGWNLAQHALARGAAAQLLRDPNGTTLLQEARRDFTALGAPFFADLASRFMGSATAERKDERYGNTTRREREIAALVAEGMSNREIAQRLVLSERTVEGHIANLFSKINVGSRTQLAAWYLKATSSVA